MTTYYKVLEENGSARMGVGKWDLPKGDKPGAWKTVEGDLAPCRNGLHLCRREDLVRWLGPAIFVAEYEGELVESDHKVVVRNARLVAKIDTWNERTARLFAADCADRALLQCSKHSGQKCDPRSRAAIRAAREFANGNISAAELVEAASAAASAAWAAVAAAVVETAVAAAAAWAAAVVETAWAAEVAARSVAAAAARSAGSAAAERDWQTKRLFEYLDGKRG